MSQKKMEGLNRPPTFNILKFHAKLVFNVLIDISGKTLINAGLHPQP
jgi:hypothetical protein